MFCQVIRTLTNRNLRLNKTDSTFAHSYGTDLQEEGHSNFTLRTVERMDSRCISKMMHTNICHVMALLNRHNQERLARY